MPHYPNADRQTEQAITGIAKLRCCVVAFYVSVVVMVGVLLALWLVLRLKPKRLKLKANVTRWASFELEMTEPEREQSS